MRKYFYSLFVIFFFLSLETSAQLSVVQGSGLGMNPVTLVRTQIVGQGVTVLNAAFNGSIGNITSQQIGTFSALNSAYQQLQLNAGVIITSGTATGAIGPNNTNYFTGPIPQGPGDADLDIIAGMATHDAAVLEFDFVPMADTLRFRYVFGSEEFFQFCNSINDAFGFFLSGPGITGTYSNNSVNIAFMPNGIDNVTINTVCNDPGSYWDNAGGIEYQFNAMTVVLTAWHIVQPCQTYHIKLAVADASDWIYDTGVFLEKNSFSATSFQVSTEYSQPNLGAQCIEGCSDAVVTFHLADVTPINDTIEYTLSGTATNGVDFPPIPASYVVVPAGEDSTFLVISPFFDGISEGTEVLVISIPMISCSGSTTFYDSIFISNKSALQPVFTPDTGACEGSAIRLRSLGSGGRSPYNYLWNTGWMKRDLDIITLPGPTDYWIRVADACGDTVIDTITVIGAPQPIINNPQTVFSICSGETTSITLVATLLSTYSWTASNPAGNITGYSGGIGDLISQPLVNNGIVTDTVYYTATANSSGCTGPPQVFKVAVHLAPSPTISGTASLCRNATGNVYTTEAGKSNYTWSVSAGGTITSGGGINDNTVTITWNNAGAQTVSVNYTEAGCSAASPYVYNVTVNDLPVPVISGPAGVCVNTDGTYSTEAGKANYTWTVSAGGTITSGAGTQSVTIHWNILGANTVTVSYMDANGCYAQNPTVYPVQVNVLPIPTVGGFTTICEGLPAVYTTEAGMSSYSWIVSAGGTITSGGGALDNTVTVLWNTAGAGSVSVNYTIGTGCTAANPSVYNVTVNPRPLPLLNGSLSVCAQTTGVVYSTDAGKTNYVWSIPAAATVTSGGTATDNTVTLTWNNPGTHTITVNYTNANGCDAYVASPLSVTVFSLPVPALGGNAAVCLNASGTYSTDAGMTNYQWVVPFGGTITSGGTATDPSVTILWTTTGAKTVSVNYVNPNGCTAPSPTPFSVTVNPLPAPTINGLNSLCSGISAIYRTEKGNNNYLWTVSPGGSIISGGSLNDSTVTILWNTAGAQIITVNYNLPTGCTAALATPYNVTVKPRPAIINASVSSSVCTGTADNYALSPDLAGTTFSWTATGTAGASGYNTAPFAGNLLSHTLTNSGFNNEFAYYTVTPSLNGCDGTPVVFTTTIFPEADVIINPLTNQFCSGLSTSFSLSSNVVAPTLTFSWTVTPSSPNIIGAAPGNGNLIQQMLTNTGNMIENVIYNITPSANGCTGRLSNAVATVNPDPVVSLNLCVDPITTTDAKPVQLKGGTPLLGTWSGPGVSGTIFNPLMAGAGTHTITYSYGNTWGCTKLATAQITVVAPVAFTCGNTLTDIRDNKTYPTVLIGTQCWMAENLNYGNTINSGNVQRDNCVTEKYCYGDNAANCGASGGLYQWDELMQYSTTVASKGVCPPSWHVPAEAEWTQLFSVFIDNGFAGSPLKFNGFSGFNALLTGEWFMNRQYDYTGFATLLWSSTQHGPYKALAHGMNEFNPSVSLYPGSRSNAFSIRCLKD